MCVGGVLCQYNDAVCVRVKGENNCNKHDGSSLMSSRRPITPLKASPPRRRGVGKKGCVRHVWNIKRRLPSASWSLKRWRGKTRAHSSLLSFPCLLLLGGGGAAGGVFGGLVPGWTTPAGAPDVGWVKEVTSLGWMSLNGLRKPPTDAWCGIQVTDLLICTYKRESRRPEPGAVAFKRR